MFIIDNIFQVRFNIFCFKLWYLYIAVLANFTKTQYKTAIHAWYNYIIFKYNAI